MVLNFVVAMRQRKGAVLLRISKKAKKTGTSRRLEPIF